MAGCNAGSQAYFARKREELAKKAAAGDEDAKRRLNQNARGRKKEENLRQRAKQGDVSAIEYLQRRKTSYNEARKRKRKAADTGAAAETSTQHSLRDADSTHSGSDDSEDGKPLAHRLPTYISSQNPVTLSAGHTDITELESTTSAKNTRQRLLGFISDSTPPALDHIADAPPRTTYAGASVKRRSNTSTLSATRSTDLSTGTTTRFSPFASSGTRQPSVATSMTDLTVQQAASVSSPLTFVDFTKEDEDAKPALRGGGFFEPTQQVENDSRTALREQELRLKMRRIQLQKKNKQLRMETNKLDADEVELEMELMKLRGGVR